MAEKYTVVSIVSISNVNFLCSNGVNGQKIIININMRRELVGCVMCLAKAKLLNRSKKMGFTSPSVEAMSDGAKNNKSKWKGSKK